MNTYLFSRDVAWSGAEHDCQGGWWKEFHDMYILLDVLILMNSKIYYDDDGGASTRNKNYGYIIKLPQQQNNKIVHGYVS